MLEELAHLGDVLQCYLVATGDELQVVIDVSESQLEHLED